MDALFPDTHRRFPTQRPPRAPRPTLPSRQAFERRYGPSNPSIFVVVLRETMQVAPIRQDPAKYTLEEKDTFGEWRNAYDPKHSAALYHLLRLDNDYNASAGYIRSGRPQQPNEALKFWLAPLSRAHLLNALLNRGERTIAQLHRDLGLKEQASARLYEYLHRWGIDWERPERQVELVDGAAQTYPARVLRANHGQGTARLRLEHYLLEVDARYDPRTRVYRTRDVLALDDLLTIPAAAHALGLTASTARDVLPITTYSTPARQPLVREAALEATLPRAQWRLSLDEAKAAVNPCRCPFFDHHARACALGHTRLPEPGTAAYACDDFTPLEVTHVA